MNRFLFIACLAVAAHAIAQPDTVRQLEEVVIQSNRIQTGFDETSASVIVVHQQQLQLSPALSIPDVLHYFAGIDIRQRGANGVQADPGIRGSTFDQVLILINGIKISDPQTGHHSLNLPIDMENVERVEIIKGPAARIYGQNAFAGAINIITKNPDKTFVKAQALAGDFGLGGARVSAALAGDRMKHYISWSTDFSDGYQYNTDYKMSNYFYQSEMTSRIGKWQFLGGFTDRKFGANGFYASPDFRDQYEEIQTSLAALTLQTAPAKNWRVTHRLYWRRNQDEYLFIRSNPAAFRNLHINNTIGYEANAQFTNTWGVTGLGLDFNTLTLRSNRLGDRERTVATLFVEHRFEWFNKRLDLTPGVQLNHYSDFGTNLFPGADVGYVLTNTLKAFGNVGYTYRVPTYTDLYYQDPANVGNPDLQPEQAVSYEAGVKWINTPHVQAQASYFRRDGRRIIDWTKAQATDPWRPDNLNNVIMSGFDVTVNYAFNHRAKNAFLQRAELGYVFIDGQEINSLGFSRYALENLKYQLTSTIQVRYTDQLRQTISYRFFDRVNLSDYQVIDTRLGWYGKALTIFADVTNLTDEVYKETNLVTLPGRWFRAGLAYTFYPSK
jgi:iron complex outermembrane receptor protein